MYENCFRSDSAAGSHFFIRSHGSTRAVSTMVNIYLIASTVCKAGGLLIRGYDENRKPVLLELVDPTYRIVVPWKTYVANQHLFEMHIPQHDVTIEEKQMNNRQAKEKLAVIHTHDYERYANLQRGLSQAGVDILRDQWMVDSDKQASLVVNVGLPCLCSWYELDLSMCNVDTKQKQLFPQYLSVEDKARTSRYIKTTKNAVTHKGDCSTLSSPSKIAYMAIHTRNIGIGELGKRKREGLHPLEEKFLEARKQWQTCPKNVGDSYRVPDAYEKTMVDSIAITSGNFSHLLALPTVSLDKEDIQRQPDEKSLLVALSHIILAVNPDIILVKDIDNDVGLLRERFDSHNILSHFNVMFTKCRESRVTVMDSDRIRCNTTISANLALCKLFKATKDLEKVETLKKRMKSRTQPRPHVLGFGVAVMEAKHWVGICMDNVTSLLDVCKLMKLENERMHQSINFEEEVRISGQNFVDYNGKLSHIRPSDLYNVEFGQELMSSGLVVPCRVSLPQCQVRGGLVLDPIPCYTFDPVLVLDFESMYASIVETFNLCTTTLSSAAGPNMCPTTVEGIFCASDLLQKGILPSVLTKWKRMRNEAKQKRCNARTEEEKSVFDMRQKAIKSCIVSMIGQNMTLTDQSPFTHSALAQAITQTGRAILQEVVNCIPTISHPLLSSPPNIVSGDTDSVLVAIQVRPTSSMDLVSLWKKKAMDALTIAKHICDTVHLHLQHIVTRHTHQNIHHLNLKVEGVSFCSLHYPTKKRYVHLQMVDNQFELVAKGVKSIQSSSTALEADMEIKALNLALKGWYLCKIKCDGWSHVEVLSPYQLQSASNIEAVFFPQTGWLEDLSFDMVAGEDGVFQMFVCTTEHMWKRTFVKDADMEVCIDFLEDELNEKDARFCMVVELMRVKFQMMRDGHFSIAELIENRQMRAQNQDESSDIAHICKARAMFGLQAPMPFEPVAYVRVKKGQSTRYDWQNVLVMQQIQDPLLVIRERLDIDIGWYANNIYKLLIGSETSLLSIMAGSIYREDTNNLNNVRNNLKVNATMKEGVFPQCKPSNLSHLPNAIESSRIDLGGDIRRVAPAMNKCLLGSVVSDTASFVTHYLVKPELAYTTEMIVACQHIAAYNSY